ncbi:MAG: cadherin-like beta sandwich domain-containing protein [Acidobacteriia bacterium]|nr:cadherin-like beta sandwich domain-containing protein [Terriglobia bacterium]
MRILRTQPAVAALISLGMALFVTSCDSLVGSKHEFSGTVRFFSGGLTDPAQDWHIELDEIPVGRLDRAGYRIQIPESMTAVSLLIELPETANPVKQAEDGYPLIEASAESGNAPVTALWPMPGSGADAEPTQAPLAQAPMAGYAVSIEQLARGLSYIHIARIPGDLSIALEIERASGPQTFALASLRVMPNREPQAAGGEDAGTDAATFNLTPKLTELNRDYRVELPFEQDAARLYAEVQPWWGEIKLQGVTISGDELDIEGGSITGLALGENRLTLEIHSEDEAPATVYSITVNRSSSPVGGKYMIRAIGMWNNIPRHFLGEAALSNGIGTGSLAVRTGDGWDGLGFSAITHASRVTVRVMAAPGSRIAVRNRYETGIRKELAGQSLSLAGMRRDGNTSIAFRSHPADNGSLYSATLRGLNDGRNNFQIAILDKDGVMQRYPLDVYRQALSGAVLHDLIFSNERLSRSEKSFNNAEEPRSSGFFEALLSAVADPIIDSLAASEVGMELSPPFSPKVYRYKAHLEHQDEPLLSFWAESDSDAEIRATLATDTDGSMGHKELATESGQGSVEQAWTEQLPAGPFRVLIRVTMEEDERVYMIDFEQSRGETAAEE